MSVRQENRFRAQSIARFREAGVLAGQIEAAGRERREPSQQAARSGTATRRQVRNWMRRNAEDHDGPTAVAEAASIALALPYGAMDDPDHWVWDEAFDAHQLYFSDVQP